jgi:hypothetical protein
MSDKCDCNLYAVTEPRDWHELVLTGHHPHCKEGGDPLEAAVALISDLATGIEAWAADEDGVHDAVFEAYQKAKRMEGINITSERR